jgi:multidrug efflux system membrane fusion protein
MTRLVTGFVLLLVAIVLVGGCQPRQRKAAPAEPPAIPISKPVQKEVTDYAEFTGRTDAVQAVDVRARVTGYLEETPFREGSEVKKGDLLFVIDQRPYQAQYDQVVGQVKLYQAALRLAKTTYDRDRTIASRATGAISQQQLDQDLAAVQEAEARVAAYESMTKVYKLNLEFTEVRSRIDGMVGRYYLTKGNLVNQDQTLLTTVVSLDPMHVYFEMDEPTLQRIKKAINEGAIRRFEEGAVPLYISLPGEEGFPHEGKINFVNNQVNPNTGSIAVRGVFSNPKPDTLRHSIMTAASVVGMAANPQLTWPISWLAQTRARRPGLRLMSPGMFVRVRLPIGRPHPALLVIDRAIGSDQGLKYVYVLDKDNKVQTRSVTTGALQDNGLRVITEGLKPDDWVVVGGLPQIRPRMVIQPDKVPMPTMTQAESRRPLPRKEDKETRRQPDKERGK